jgi:hypothetical protein
LPVVNLGGTNFEDGFAGPGFLLEEFPEVYSANTLKDQQRRKHSRVKHANFD